MNIIEQSILIGIVINAGSAFIIGICSFLLWLIIKNKVEFRIFSKQTSKSEIYRNRIEGLKLINKILSSVERELLVYTSELQIKSEKENATPPVSIIKNLVKFRELLETYDIFLPENINKLLKDMMEKSFEAFIKRSSSAANLDIDYQYSRKLWQRSIEITKKISEIKIQIKLDIIKLLNNID